MRGGLKLREILFTLIILIIASRRGWAQETPVWRIGAFDYSSNEFRSQGIDYSDPKQDPVYRVGQSKDSEDWWRFQPGPANGMTGGREHPFTILFGIQQPPRGVYRLTIAVLYETPRLSNLRLNLNGHSGRFYFHPKLDYRAGDWEGTFVPQTSWDKKTIEFPAEWFQPGENRLVLHRRGRSSTSRNLSWFDRAGHTGLVL